jgi:hypothetical protein
VERSARVAGAALEVSRLRRRQRFVPIDVDERVQMPIERVDAIQACGDDLLRCRFAGPSAGDSRSGSSPGPGAR